MMIWLVVSSVALLCICITHYQTVVCVSVCKNILCTVDRSLWKVSRWEVENVRTCVFPLQHIHHELCMWRCMHTHTCTACTNQWQKKAYAVFMCRESLLETRIDTYTHSIHHLTCVSACVCVQARFVWVVCVKELTCLLAWLLAVVFVCIETASHSSHSFLNTPHQF